MNELPKMENQEKHMRLEQVKSFVERNIVHVKYGRKCVDGRYDDEKSKGMIARPGADFGYVMALLALNKDLNLGLTSQECFDKVFDVVIQENGGKFYMHTDHHADPERGEGQGLIGCGHIAKASKEKYMENYGVSSGDIIHLTEYARQLIKSGRPIEMINLEGEHDEKGVLVVKGTEKTVNPTDGKNMFFVYDTDRDEEFMCGLVEKMGIHGVNIDNFKKASNKQLNATLGILAEGRPMYQVNVDNEEPIVSFLQIVS